MDRRLRLSVDVPKKKYPDELKARVGRLLHRESDPEAGIPSLRVCRESAAGISVPVTSRQRALTNLYAAVPVLDQLFEGSVSEHAEFLREAMRWLPGAMVTIEWWVGGEPSGLPRGDLDRVLALYDSVPGAVDVFDALTRVTGLTVGSRIAKARLLLDGAAVTELRRADLHRIVGRSHMRMVPWETPF